VHNIVMEVWGFRSCKSSFVYRNLSSKHSHDAYLSIDEFGYI